MESKPGSGKPDEALSDVRYVFFDVGGTLLQAETPAADIFRRALAARGHLLDREKIAQLLRTPESIVSLIRPLPADRAADYYRLVNTRVVEHLGFEADDAMLDEIHAAFNQPVAWRLYPDVLGLLKELRKAGYRLGVISNASHDLPDVLRKIGIAAHLDTITYSFDVGAEKPNVRIFRRALAQAAATPETSVHVGDSYEADYLGAREAGMHAVLLCREAKPPEPCPSIRSLAELRRFLTGRRSRP